MPIDTDVAQRFNEHEKVLDKHSEEIDKIKEVQTKILVSQAEMNVKLSSIEASQYDIKKSITENSLAQRDFEKELINKLIDNDNNRDQRLNETNKFTLQKYSDLAIKAVGILGIIYGAKEIITK